jgi:hypothetical protein
MRLPAIAILNNFLEEFFLKSEKNCCPKKKRSSGSKGIKVTDDHLNSKLVFVPYEFQNDFLSSKPLALSHSD